MRYPHDARQRAFALLLLIALLGWSRGWTTPADAATGPVPGACVLGFGAAYSVGGTSRTHLGADLGGAPGAQVGAPVDGVVAFAGPIPATDGSGSRALCVTISSGTDRWTLLPLDSVTVEPGEQVAEGEAVGRLAGSGDGSSAETHLHVGLKRGSAYMDPMAQLSAAGAAVSSGGGGEASGDGDSSDEDERDRGRPEPGALAAEAPAGAPAGAPVGSREPVARPVSSPALPVPKGSTASRPVSGRADRARAAGRPSRARAEPGAGELDVWQPAATAGAVRLAGVIALSACAAAALAAGAVSVRRSILEERQEAVEARAGP